ncbi:hypothetical protein F0562_034259 [Nyssa sinensis]|uniref:Myb/SANT-like domain-containing protein n=1 Tax=Nyssa sinensis TaxID=561372 RepID=A0A5J5AKI0_9ASTE|nr:hypothetical protein F0562_034259 [Nyssa sinensis]
MLLIWNLNPQLGLDFGSWRLQSISIVAFGNDYIPWNRHFAESYSQRNHGILFHPIGLWGMGKAQDERQNSEEKTSKIKKRQWTRKEDKALIEALLELYNTGWKRDNGTFKSGYTAVLEKEMKSRLPGCNLKASPHIDSRLKTLKKHCDAITDMRGAIGIRWNNEEHTVMCEDDDIWEDWVKIHSDAKGLRNKPFPYYDDLCIIFGKNRANFKGVENASGGKELDCEEANNNAEPMMGVDGSNGMNRANGKHVKNAFGLGKKLANMEANDNAVNAMGTNEPNEVDVSVDNLEAIQMPLQGASTSATHPSKKRSRSSDSWSSGLGEVTKMFGTFLEKYEQQFSLLVRLLGRQEAADTAAAEKRARLNGELMKIPNLSLQARLRAASLIFNGSCSTGVAQWPTGPLIVWYLGMRAAAGWEYYSRDGQEVDGGSSEFKASLALHSEAKAKTLWLASTEEEEDICTDCLQF